MLSARYNGHGRIKVRREPQSGMASSARPRFLLSGAVAAGLLLWPLALAAQDGHQIVPQPPPAPSAESEKQRLYALMDQIRIAIRLEDWPEALRLSFQLNSSLLMSGSKARQMDPSLELAHLEMLAGKDATTRGAQLPRLVRAAFAARQYTLAEGYAREALDAAKHGTFPWTGDAIFEGNTILGRLALRKGDLRAADEYLIAAGKTPGSSSLDAIGPSMTLAHDLLMENQWEPVIGYLEECQQFWVPGARKLAEWLALTRARLIPDFGQNLE